MRQSKLRRATKTQQPSCECPLGERNTCTKRLEMATAKATVNLINKRACSSVSLSHPHGNGIMPSVKSKKAATTSCGHPTRSLALAQLTVTGKRERRAAKHHYHVMPLACTFFGGGVGEREGERAREKGGVSE